MDAETKNYTLNIMPNEIMTNEALFSYLCATVLGAGLTALGVFLQSYWQQAAQQKEKGKEILRVKRVQLDENIELLNIVEDFWRL